ncbi:hypothetical protein GRAN_0473 [Granulicella sibirica]|uniref:Uncharacterized protein n=1 Tax=Granulicella sibirica TaxID=2479048 RepID=A0A4Q0T0P4_9BACT|nr:hypothetical protein GRAN_0473 [Granulicella sibirica]
MVILLMEFQLYSVRHPEIQNRLTDVSMLGQGTRKTSDEAYSA